MTSGPLTATAIETYDGRWCPAVRVARIAGGPLLRCMSLADVGREPTDAEAADWGTRDARKVAALADTRAEAIALADHALARWYGAVADALMRGDPRRVPLGVDADAPEGAAV